MLEHFGEVCRPHPVIHGLILFRSSTPLGISPSTARWCRIEVSQDCHSMTVLPGLLHQVMQRISD